MPCNSENQLTNATMHIMQYSLKWVCENQILLLLQYQIIIIKRGRIQKQPLAVLLKPENRCDKTPEDQTFMSTK